MSSESDKTSAEDPGSINGSTLLSLKPVQRILQINGEPGIVSYVNGRVQSVFTLQVNDGRIDAIFIVTNPKKLSHLPPAVS